MESCIQEIRNWMCVNLLKPNDDKTEFIIFGTAQQLKKINNIKIKVGEAESFPVEFIRNLGYFMDSLMKNTHHINKLTSTLYNILKKLPQTRSYLDTDTTKIIIQALVLCKLDYCNSLLLGSSELQLDKLQRIQNVTCRVIFNLNKYDYNSPQLESLHWLEVQGKMSTR